MSTQLLYGGNISVIKLSMIEQPWRKVSMEFLYNAEILF